MSDSEVQGDSANHSSVQGDSPVRRCRRSRPPCEAGPPQLYVVAVRENALWAGVFRIDTNTTDWPDLLPGEVLIVGLVVASWHLAADDEASEFHRIMHNIWRKQVRGDIFGFIHYRISRLAIFAVPPVVASMDEVPDMLRSERETMMFRPGGFDPNCMDAVTCAEAKKLMLAESGGRSFRAILLDRNIAHHIALGRCELLHSIAITRRIRRGRCLHPGEPPRRAIRCFIDKH